MKIGFQKKIINMPERKCIKRLGVLEKNSFYTVLHIFSQAFTKYFNLINISCMNKYHLFIWGLSSIFLTMFGYVIYSYYVKIDFNIYQINSKIH